MSPYRVGTASVERPAVKQVQLLSPISRCLWVLAAIWIAFPLSARSTPASPPVIVLVVGAPGEPGFATNFLQQVHQWTQAAQSSGTRVVTFGTDPEESPDDRSRLEAFLAAEPRTGDAPLWLVLIGHGTFDGKEARFNLRGPDVSATELAAWLVPFQRPLVLINTTSASAPFLQKLSGSNRIVITATRSGHEQNVTRFGGALAASLQDPAADLDADEQVSLFEAFLSASQRVAESYQEEGRLLTEHALLDDNGDGLGTPPDWFRGLRPVRQPKDGKSLDGTRAHQLHLIPSAAEQQLSLEARARRDELERRIVTLREQKANRAEDAYYAQLEKLLLELARIYRDAGTVD